LKAPSKPKEISITSNNTLGGVLGQFSGNKEELEQTAELNASDTKSDLKSDALSQSQDRIFSRSRLGSALNKYDRNLHKIEGKEKDVIQMYKSKPLEDSIFNRLWLQSQKKEEKLQEKRKHVRNKEQLNWKIALANKNQLQKNFDGMTVYCDNISGQNYVHMEDLRMRVNQTLNQKQSFLHQQLLISPKIEQEPLKETETRDLDSQQFTLNPKYGDVPFKDLTWQQQQILVEENY